MSKPVPDLGTVVMEFSVAHRGSLGRFEVVLVLSTTGGVDFGNDFTPSKERMLRSTGKGRAIKRQVPLPERFFNAPLRAVAKASAVRKPKFVGLVAQ